MQKLGADRYEEKDNYVLFPTICHNIDSSEASMKLYFYKDTKLFVCYTECGNMSIFKFLRHYYENRQIEYDWYEDIYNAVLNCSTFNPRKGFSQPVYQSLKDRYIVREHKELEVYSSNVLDCFVKRYPIEWINDGISKEAMDKFNILYSISQNKMDEVVKKTTNIDQNYKQLLSIFKNSQTNVPYIKSVNGKDYWFVNGKLLNPVNLSPITNNSDNTNSYYPNYIYDSTTSQNDLLIEADISTLNGGKTKKYLLNAFEMPEAGYKLNINYDIKYQNVSCTDISQMSFQIIDEDGNSSAILLATKIYRCTLTDINKTKVTLPTKNIR